jgi:glycosyltransferase involved in cell wall biosynthesis
MQISTPKVTVCIPTYNPDNFLHSAIRSVLDQDFTDFELLVVDDCSSQPVEGHLRTIVDNRISFFRNPRNLGLVGNWNRCLELANGQYVTLLHHDDLMAAQNLSLKAAMLDAHHNIGFVFSNIRRMDEHGRVIGGHWTQQPENDTVMPGHCLFSMVASAGNPVSCPSVMMRAASLKSVGHFDHRLPFATDLEMWLRLARRSDVGYIAAPLIFQRVHSRQETARFQGTGRDYTDVLRSLGIAFSGPMPQEYRRYERPAYRTLCSQSIAMARWKVRQGEVVRAAKYAAVALTSLKRVLFGTSA